MFSSFLSTGGIRSFQLMDHLLEPERKNLVKNVLTHTQHTFLTPGIFGIL